MLEKQHSPRFLNYGGPNGDADTIEVLWKDLKSKVSSQTRRLSAARGNDALERLYADLYFLNGPLAITHLRHHPYRDLFNSFLERVG